MVEFKCCKNSVFQREWIPMGGKECNLFASLG